MIISNKYLQQTFVFGRKKKNSFYKNFIKISITFTCLAYESVNFNPTLLKCHDDREFVHLNNNLRKNKNFR